MLKQKNILRCLCLMLAAVLLTGLCPAAFAKNSVQIDTAVVQVIYATSESYFASERVNVSQINSVVSPNSLLVPEGYEPVNTNPVPLIFDTSGRPIPNLIYFTYKKPVQGHQIKVEYATMSGVFNEEYVTITPESNVVSPNADMVPAGYIPLNANAVTVPFRNNKPVVDTVRFTYFIDQELTTGSTAQNIIMNWDVPGEIIIFGHYEQDGNESNGKEPMEWIALRVQMGRVLLLARHAIYTRPYNTEWKEISWKDCSLRAWLNSSFLKNCFSTEEKKALITAKLTTNYAGASVTTEDMVFLLDVTEAKALSDELLLCKPTRYAREKSTATTNGFCYWWLRDTTNRKNDANRVEPSGAVSEYGGNTNATGVGIRPAIWVDVEKAFGK